METLPRPPLGLNNHDPTMDNSGAQVTAGEETGLFPRSPCLNESHCSAVILGCHGKETPLRKRRHSACVESSTGYDGCVLSVMEDSRGDGAT